MILSTIFSDLNKVLDKYAKRFVGAGGGFTRPYKSFLGAGGVKARPYKWICRGGWSPKPPLQIVSQFFLKNYLIRKNSKPHLKHMKFPPLAYNNLWIWWIIPTIQFMFFSVWMCAKDKVSLKLYERVMWHSRG